MRLRRPPVILLAIVLLAVAVRVVGLQFGLPYAYARPDETEVAGPAVTYLAEGTLRPQFFQWPSLFSYLVAALYAMYGGLFGFVTGHASIADFVNSRYDLFAPFLLIPRTFSMVMGVATVVSVHALGRRLFGDTVGLVAALFLALAFLHVRDSHFGMSDVTMTAFVVLATLAGVAWDERGGYRRAIVAGLLAGLAGSTKYNGLAAGACFAVAAGLHLAGSRPPAAAARPDARPAASTAAVMLVFAGAAALGFFGGSPYILIEWSRFLADVGTVQAAMAGGHGGLQVGRGWWYFGRVVLPAALGWPIFLGGVVGVAGLLVTRARRSSVLLAFPIAYYLYAGQSYSVFARYILPVVPFLCITAAWLIVTLAQHGLATARPSVRGAAVALIALAAVAPTAWASIQLDRLLARTDNRIVAANALAPVLPADDLIHQSGSSYGRVPLGLNGRGAELREVAFDSESGTFSPAEPRWVLVQRSPLRIYSRVPDALTRVLAARYALVASWRTDEQPSTRRVYDQQDAFYLPLSGFAGLRRPGPAFELYRRRE